MKNVNRQVPNNNSKFKNNIAEGNAITLRLSLLVLRFNYV